MRVLSYPPLPQRRIREYVKNNVEYYAKGDETRVHQLRWMYDDDAWSKTPISVLLSKTNMQDVILWAAQDKTDQPCKLCHDMILNCDKLAASHGVDVQNETFQHVVVRDGETQGTLLRPAPLLTSPSSSQNPYAGVQSLPHRHGSLLLHS